MSVWRNRQKKIIETPLFPNYIFVHAAENEIYRIERIPKIVTLVRFDRQPATIGDREIGVVRKMINSNKDISVENQLLVGGQVEIISGVLAGCRGILVGQTGKKQFAVQLKEFNHTVLIDINENELRLI
jgi:transcription antitermination factor NusG